MKAPFVTLIAPLALAPALPPRHNPPVAFNSATGIGVPNAMADSRPYAAFFMSVRNTIGTSSAAGRGGRVLALAGSHSAGTPILPRACHPRLASGGGLTPRYGGHAMSKLHRALRALFSRTHSAVSIVRPAANLADARRVAADLVAAGARVRIQPAGTGFDVMEVQQ